MQPRVVIDVGPPCVRRFQRSDAVVVVDVIRSTTTALTALAKQRRCIPVGSLPAAYLAAQRLSEPLLVGELGGKMPPGFDLDNSPAALDGHAEPHRPVVLLSSSGTRLFAEVTASPAGSVYAACFRNRRATADWLAAHHARVVVMGALSRDELREEDQMCCAQLAERLLLAGFAVEDETTHALIERWSGAPPDAFLQSRSVAFLRETGQLDDLAFILQHFDDLDTVALWRGGELTALSQAAAFTRRAG